MSKQAKITHYTLLAICFGCFAWQFIYYLMHWGSLPDEPGIHFSPSGTFDVHASKIYGFYPHLLSSLALTVDLVFTWIVRKEKLKLGLKVNQKGKSLIIASIVVTFDIVTVSILLCFCGWVYAVSNQNEAIMGSYPRHVLLPATAITLAGIFFQCIVNAVFKEKAEADSVAELSDKEKKKRKLLFLLTGSADGFDLTKHRTLIRIVSWIFIGMITLITAFCLDRLPANDLADNYHGLAYFANFGEYYPKWLVFIPGIVMVPFMVMFEIIGMRAVKKNKPRLSALADMLKLTFAVFGSWWELLLSSESAIRSVSVTAFTLICASAFVKYFLSGRSAGSVSEDDKDKQ